MTMEVNIEFLSAAVLFAANKTVGRHNLEGVWIKDGAVWGTDGHTLIELIPPSPLEHDEDVFIPSDAIKTLEKALGTPSKRFGARVRIDPVGRILESDFAGTFKVPIGPADFVSCPDFGKVFPEGNEVVPFAVNPEFLARLHKVSKILGSPNPCWRLVSAPEPLSPTLWEEVCVAARVVIMPMRR